MHASNRRPAAGTTLPLAAVVLALAAFLAPIGTASAARPVSPSPEVVTPAKPKTIKVAVDPRLFGVHDANLNSLSRAGTGSIRLWDTGVTWDAMQPTPGAPDFSRLDQIVTDAHRNGTEVTLVLAMTPKFAAPDPDSPSYETEVPDLAAYRSFVTAVMTHYRSFFGPGVRGIANYQVWNEANITTFWAGTPAQMAQLTRTVWQVRNAVDPGATVVGPAFVTRLGYQQKWIKQFYAQKVGGKPVWKYLDVISLNLYPIDIIDGRPATPEDSMTLLGQVRALLAKDRVPSTIPVWDTEINYGMRTGALGGTSAAPIPDALQVAYLMRTYLLNAAQGIGRVDWYAYDMGNQPAERGGLPLGNTLLTDSADRAAGTLTPAGLAFTRVQQWMKGTLIGTTRARPCAADKHGTYTCLVRYAKKRYGRIYWNPYGTGKVTLVASARHAYSEFGVARRVKGGSKLKVNYAPVLVRSSH